MGLACGSAAVAPVAPDPPSDARRSLTGAADPTAAAAATWAAGELERVEVCPLCGAQGGSVLYDALEDRLFGSTGAWSIRRCAGCGTGYLDPRPTTDALQKAYACYYTHDEPPGPPVGGGPARRVWRAVRNGYLNGSLGYRLRPAIPLADVIAAPLPRRRLMARRLVRDLPLGPGRNRLLDVGCGNGGFLVTMNWAGWDAEGLEPDTRAVAAARRRGLTVHEGTLTNSELPPSSFDAITFNHVLEHLPAPLDEIARCSELLRPGGILWIAAPNFASLGHGRFEIDWLGLDVPRHLVIPTAASLRDAVERAGFTAELRPGLSAVWFYRQSAQLEARRAGRLLTPASRARVTAEAKIADWRASRDLLIGEEVVVLARNAEEHAGPRRR